MPAHSDATGSLTVTTDVPAGASRTGAGRPGDSSRARVSGWPLLLLAAPAFVAIWSGWVGLGDLTGFGVVHPLPGIANDFTLNTAITLPIGVETYAAFALRVWLSGTAPAPARRFARWSALGSLALGAAGQIAYHLMAAAGITSAPWQITAAVACLPVAVLGMGAALAHLITHTAPDVVDAPATLALDEASLAGRVPVPHKPAPATGATASRAVAPAVRGRRPGSGGPGTDTGARVAQLRAAHPDMTAGQIARRLSVTDRTVRRHLAALAGQPAPVDEAPGLKALVVEESAGVAA